jgi:hypothetical protein
VSNAADLTILRARLARAGRLEPIACGRDELASVFDALDAASDRACAAEAQSQEADQRVRSAELAKQAAWDRFAQEQEKRLSLERRLHDAETERDGLRRAYAEHAERPPAPAEQPDRFVLLERVARAANEVLERVAEFPKDPGAWSEALGYLDSTVAELGKPRHYHMSAGLSAEERAGAVFRAWAYSEKPMDLRLVLTEAFRAHELDAAAVILRRARSYYADLARAIGRKEFADNLVGNHWTVEASLQKKVADDVADVIEAEGRTPC